MSTPKDQTFLTYYNNELAYLRQAGHQFAKQHPNAANRLDLSNHPSSDPHTEKLLESFAFLTSKLHQHIDNSLIDVSLGLLYTLYPALTAPTPSMTIAKVIADPTATTPPSQAIVKKQTTLFAHTKQEDITCRFQTVYPLQILPLTIVQAQIIHGNNCFPQTEGWYLSLSIECTNQGKLDWSSVDTLTVHIAGEYDKAMAIYESLFAQHQTYIGVELHHPSFAAPLIFHIPCEALEPLGFSPQETALPITALESHAHILLKEFFHFPQKFLFLKISKLQKVFDELSKLDNQKLARIQLYIRIGARGILAERQLSFENFHLGCTPIINLFSKITDPLRIDHKKTEYRLIPDQRREHSFDIYSIESMILTNENTNQSEEIPSYFSVKHYEENAKVFWHARRSKAHMTAEDNIGSDMYISFVDLTFTPESPPSQIIYAHTLCTNRHYAASLSPQSTLFMEAALPFSSLFCLEAPNAAKPGTTNGEGLWQMVSLLSSHFLTCSNNQNSLSLLKERLYLYAGASLNHKQALKSIESLEEMIITPIIRRHHQDVWRGFTQGIEIALRSQETPYMGSDTYLLTSILQRYFAMTITMNSCVETVLFGNNFKGEWMRWKAFNGEKKLL